MKKNPQKKTTAMMIPSADVEGWPLYRPSGPDAGERYIRDLDLAERAGLNQPRGVRRTISSCIEDGLIFPAASSEVIALATNAATFTEVLTTASKGNRGGSQAVREFYLSETAALHVIMRLRTDRAVQLQQEVVRVYLAVRRGEVAMPVPMPTLVGMTPEIAHTLTEIPRLLVRHEERVSQLQTQIRSLEDRYAQAELDRRTLNVLQQNEMRRALIGLAQAMRVTFPVAEGVLRRESEANVRGYRHIRYVDYGRWMARITELTEEAEAKAMRAVVDSLPDEEEPLN
ncbi:MAG: hypothetical protein KF764_03105 [Labilithrix sp.]|nr:hypothetical protein [Labilithrix sp.]